MSGSGESQFALNIFNGSPPSGRLSAGMIVLNKFKTYGRGYEGMRNDAREPH
jgi:hypothetical protein